MTRQARGIVSALETAFGFIPDEWLCVEINLELPQLLDEAEPEQHERETGSIERGCFR